MSKTIFSIDDVEVKNSKFYKSKYLVDTNEVDNDKIIISSNVFARF